MDTQLIVQWSMRPYRYAFLVPPNDTQALEEAIQVSTMLWGGAFNPIIPCRRDTDRSVVNAVEVFRPDALVSSPGVELSDGSEVLPTSLLVDDLASDRLGSLAGLRMENVYEHLFETEFRFQQRDPQKVALMRPPDKALSTLVAAYAGAFATAHHSTEAWFRDQLGAEEQALNFSSPSEERRVLTPLLLTTETCDARRRIGPIFLFLNPRSPYDIAEFWNLRAAGAPVFPVPSDRWSSCVGGIREFLAEYHHDHDPARYSTRPTITRASTTEIEEFAPFLAAVEEAGNLRVRSDPPDPLDVVAINALLGPDRPGVSERGTQVLAVSGSGRASLELALPAFHDTVERKHSAVCVNEFRFQGSGDGWCPEVLPTGTYGRVFASRYTLRSNGSALVADVSSRDERLDVRIPTTADVASHWLASRAIRSRLSSAGRVASGVMRFLGTRATPQLLSPAMVKVLRQAAKDPGVPYTTAMQLLKGAMARDLPDEKRVRAFRSRIRTLCHSGALLSNRGHG